MKSTIRTEAGVATLEAEVGRVAFNGGSMLPHEAALLGSELIRIAERADDKAREATVAAFNLKAA